VFLFSHLRDSQSFYQSLVRSRKADAIFKSGGSPFSQQIESALTTPLRVKAKTTVPVPILAHYLASELFTLLQWWLDHRMPYPPERMDEIFHALVTPTFRTMLE